MGRTDIDYGWRRQGREPRVAGPSPDDMQEGGGVAFFVARVNLGINDVVFDPPEAETVLMVEGLAAGKVGQGEFANWMREHAK